MLWLADRAQLSELLHSFARALDTRDLADYADNFEVDGVIELPQPEFAHVKLTPIWLAGDPSACPT